MSRQEIRRLKREMTNGLYPGVARESLVLATVAVVLHFERSIRFGHGRLSVVRLAIAAQSGASIPREHWNYCKQVASSSKDSNTQSLYMEAARLVAYSTIDPSKDQ